MFSLWDDCQRSIDSGADFLIVVNGNQPGLSLTNLASPVLRLLCLLVAKIGSSSIESPVDSGPALGVRLAANHLPRRRL